MSLELSYEDFLQVKNVTNQDYNWYIGRGSPKHVGSPLQNPHHMRSEKDRWQVCDDFEDYFDKMIAKNDPTIMQELYSIMDYLRAGIKINLGCYCAPRRCHGDHIRKKVLYMLQDAPKTPRYRFSKHTGYECSTLGDKRFSALVATMLDGRTIEMHYQCDVKGYQPGGTDWKLGKGKPPVDKAFKTPEVLYCEYIRLWRDWSYRNEDLMEELRDAAEANDCTLRDSFMTSKVNQARALAQLLSERWPQGPQE